MQAVTNKKSTLLKDKDRPDLGDSSSLLFNSSQFGLSSSASPGGGLSNRKTRHTRHKLEVDDIGTSGNGSKRKRKANIDANASSPEPAGRAALPDSILHWKDTHSKHESQQMTTAQVTVEDLFSQRELDLHLQSASHAAIDTITTKRRKISEEGQSSSTLSNAEASDMEGDEAEAGKGASTNLPDVEIEDPFLAAPEMDRTANSSMHQTRSTRNTIREVPIASFDIPSDLYGRATAISLIGTYNKERKKEEEYQRAPPLTDGEKENDLAMITAAIREEEASPGSMNKKAKKDLLPAVTDYVSAAFQDSTNSAPFEKK